MTSKASHRVIEPRVLYFGTPVVLISTVNVDGSPNLAPMSSAWWVGRSCMLGLDATSQTTSNIQRTGELVLNLPDSSMADFVDRIALLTGTADVPLHKVTKGYRYAPDKFERGGLSPVPSDLVAPPRTAECPIALEAEAEAVRPFGGEDSGILAVEARIVRTHVDPTLLVDGSDRHIDPERWDPLLMKFTHYYGRATNMRHSRLAEGWRIPRVQPSNTGFETGDDHHRCDSPR